MKLKLDATREELKAKGPQLVDALARAFAKDAPDIADALSKAVQPMPAGKLHYPVMQGLREEMVNEYNRQMKLMVEEIMEVIDRAAAEEDTAKSMPFDESKHPRGKGGQFGAKGRSHGILPLGVPDLTNVRIGGDAIKLQFHKELRPAYIRAAHEYADGGDFSRVRINDALRSGWKHSAAYNLDAAIQCTSLAHTSLLERGCHEFADYEVGDEFQDPAFVSTSTSSHVARKYAEQKGGPGVLLHIVAHPGSRALPIDHLQQQELLLPRGSRFRVLAVEIDKGLDPSVAMKGARHLYLELLP